MPRIRYRQPRDGNYLETPRRALKDQKRWGHYLDKSAGYLKNQKRLAYHTQMLGECSIETESDVAEDDHNSTACVKRFVGIVSKD